MPDAAVEAARLGLPYIEPTSIWTKKAKVRFEAVPDTYGGAPRQRRIIEPDRGFWGGLFGIGGSERKASKHSLAQGLCLPLPTPAPPPKSSWWKPTFSDFRPLPIPTPSSAPATAIPPLSTLAPSPFPAGLEQMPREAQKHYKKKYKAELKAMAAWERSQMEAMRAAEIEKRRKEKDEARAKKEEEKMRNKALKYAQKYPYGERQLPWIPPPAHSLHPYYTYPSPSPSLIPPITPATAAAGPGPVERWVMAPTLEEFGVRRPFNAPVEQKGPTIGGVECSMMSRTMHHALVDLAREENLHRLQAGQKMPGMPGY